MVGVAIVKVVMMTLLKKLTNIMRCGKRQLNHLLKMNYFDLFLDSWKILKNKKTLILIGVEFLFFILLTIGALVSVTFITERAQNLQAFQQEFQVDENANPTYLYQNLLLLSQMLDKKKKSRLYYFIKNLLKQQQ